jgi:hypothetical protein
MASRMNAEKPSTVNGLPNDRDVIVPRLI